MVLPSDVAPTAEPGRPPLRGVSEALEPTSPAPALEVLVLAPTGRDAPLIVESLTMAGIEARAVAAADELIQEVAVEVDQEGSPRLGTILATDDALAVDWSVRLACVLDRQRSWSDLPIVLLARSDGRVSGGGWREPRSPTPVAERLTGRGSVTVLERPVHTATLVSAVRAALRARARQAEVRDLIETRDRALADAERAIRVRDEVMAILSHDLRNPLAAIQMSASFLLELAKEGAPEVDRRGSTRSLEVIQRQAAAANRLIEDLLDVSRIEAGVLRIHPEKQYASALLEDACESYRPLVEGNGLQLACEAIDPLPVVRADRDRVLQAFGNLIGNAVKFTPAGGAVRLGAQAMGDEVRFSVTDTGEGIPAESLPRLFDRFYQVRRTGRSSAGLGLTIVKGIIEAHGGRVWVESEIGYGSTFHFTLPVAGAAATDAE